MSFCLRLFHVFFFCCSNSCSPTKTCTIEPLLRGVAVRGIIYPLRRLILTPRRIVIPPSHCNMGPCFARMEKPLPFSFPFSSYLYTFSTIRGGTFALAVELEVTEGIHLLYYQLPGKEKELLFGRLHRVPRVSHSRGEEVFSDRRTRRSLELSCLSFRCRRACDDSMGRYASSLEIRQ